MERRSDKHSPLRDDQLKHETAGLVGGGKDTHAEEWKSQEPAGEDQPEVAAVPDTPRHGGVPVGMTDEDVEERAELSRYLGRVFPAGREALLAQAIGRHAPDRVVARIRQLPDGQGFRNLGEVWRTLGGGSEQQRF